MDSMTSISINDTQHNVIQRNDTQYMKFSMKRLSIIAIIATLSLMDSMTTISINDTQHNVIQHNDFIIMTISLVDLMTTLNLMG
jgi:hypothetical protein